MTLLPADDFGIRGHEGKAYKVNEICCVPGCGHRSIHTHHMWPRSFLRGQPYEWVQLPDGTVIGNRVGLCSPHHDNVTGEIGGHQARIVFRNGIFWWEAKVYDWMADELEPPASWRRDGPIDPQPPGVRDMPPARREAEVCPTCGHHKRKELPPGPPRPKKTWTVMVPADAEDGAEVLNTIVEDLAIPLGAADWKSTLKRYYVLVAVLGWTAQHRDEFVDDIAEVAAS